MRAPVGFLGLATLALAIAGCGHGTSAADGTPTATHAADASFSLVSADFTDGGTLPETAKANAFGGQCKGENVSPELSWSGGPDGTAAYAITLIDTDASSFVHWTKADIPAEVTEIQAGGADAVAGVGGRTGNSQGTYFGPCPPGGEHHYVFTVYALDAPLGLDANFGIVDLNKALKAHVLAQASITGLAGKTP